MAYEQLLKNVQLMDAVDRANLAKVERLLRDGADVNFVNLHGKNETPLHVAVHVGDPDIVEKLLTSGANPELQNVVRMKPINLLRQDLDASKRKAITALLESHQRRDESVVADRKETVGSTFTKRSGTANVGQFYETKMLTMALFRLQHDDHVEEFMLGNNLDEAGAFDDIVLKVRAVDGLWRVICVQCKHSKPDVVIKTGELFNLTASGNFSLVKYFESYLKIHYSFDPNSEDGIFRGEFEQTELELIIFTPAVIDCTSKICEVTKSDNLFYTSNTGKIIKLRCSEELEIFVEKSEEWHEKQKKMIENLEEDSKKGEEAHVKLTKHKNLPQENIKDLKKVAKRGEEAHVKLTKLKKQHEKIKKGVTQGKKAHVTLVEGFFARLRLYSEQATEDKLEEIVRRDMKAKGIASDALFFTKLYNGVESWWKRAGNHVPLLTRDCEIYEIAMHQTELDKVHEISLSRVKIDEVKFDVNKTTRCEMVKLLENDFFNIFSRTPELCCVRVCQFLQTQGTDFKFVIIDSVKFCESLLKAQASCLIVAYLPKADNEIVKIICQSVKKSIVVTRAKLECNWASVSGEISSLLDLKTESQTKILQTKLTFQGCSVQLPEKVPGKLIDAEILHEIMYSEGLFVSNNSFSADFEELRGCYLKRDVVHISSKKLQPIGKIPNSVAFIAADPGMGKSTLLAAYATEIKQSDPLKWVIIMNLLDLSAKFKKWTEENTEITKQHALDLLLEITSYKSGQIRPLERMLFNFYCRQRNIILLIDAVDEVSPNYTSKVLKLIEICRQNFAAQLRVTTRYGPVVQELEQCKNSVEYSLEPFTRAQSKLFLRMFWETKLKTEFDPQKFELYHSLLLSHLPEKSDAGKDDLVSIPMQIKMIATLFTGHFDKYCTTGQAPFEKLDLVSLYEQFIEMQFDVLLEDKNKIDPSKPYNQFERNENLKKISITHKLAALGTLFELMDTSSLFNEHELRNRDEFYRKVQESQERTGIITKIVSGKPHFVHRTYAEFFAAQFIWDKFSLSPSEELDVFYRFTSNIFHDELHQVTRFLHQIVQKRIIEFTEEVIAKTTSLLNHLMNLLNKFLKKFVSKTFASLLGIVEGLVASNDECYQVVKQFVIEQTGNRNLLLLVAAESGHPELLRMVTEDDQDRIEASFDRIKDAIASQIENNQSPWEKQLNEKKDKEILDSFRFSVLHRAARSGSVKAVSYLLERNEPKDVETNLNETPLYLACEAGHLEVVQTLIGAEANINTQNKGLFTPLNIATRNGHLSVVRALLEANANDDLNTPSFSGDVPLHNAAIQGFTKIVQLFLEKETNLNVVTTPEGFTPLHCAVKNNFVDIARLLLAKGANIDSATEDRGTALHLAVDAVNLEMVQFLIGAGADVNAVDKVGMTALSCAVKKHSIVQTDAVDKKNIIEIVKVLLDKGALLHEWDKGWTMLHEAAAANSLELVKLFLQKGIDINRRARYGVTPLLLACFARNNQMVKLMLDKGADVKLGTYVEAYMPMHCAAEKNRHEMIILLVKKGAAIDCVTRTGYTPLEAARRKDSKEAVKILKKMGAHE